MTRFVSLHTGQFIIRPRAVRRQRTVWLGCLLLALLVPYVCFELGRMSAGFSVVSSQRARLAQAGQIATLHKEAASLRRELGSVQVGRTVDQLSSDAVQQSLNELQARITQQDQELAFYKAIVTPADSAPQQPRVQRLEILPETLAGQTAGQNDQQFRLRLVLIQSLQATSTAQGSVRITLQGSQRDAAGLLTPQSHTVEQLITDRQSGKDAGALTYQYRYFQTLEPIITLPTGFVPAVIQVEVRDRDHAPLRQQFDWRPASA